MKKIRSPIPKMCFSHFSHYKYLKKWMWVVCLMNVSFPHMFFHGMECGRHVSMVLAMASHAWVMTRGWTP
jgi:hypothetical protein